MLTLYHVLRLVDVFNVRTFDFYTSTTTTGHNSAFYGRPSDSNPLANSVSITFFEMIFFIMRQTMCRVMSYGFPHEHLETRSDDDNDDSGQSIRTNLEFLTFLPSATLFFCSLFSEHIPLLLG